MYRTHRCLIAMQAAIAQAQTYTREGEGLPAEEAGRVIADAIISKRPRTRYTVGRDAAIIVRLARWLSDRMLDGLLAPVSSCIPLKLYQRRERAASDVVQAIAPGGI